MSENLQLTESEIRQLRFMLSNAEDIRLMLYGIAGYPSVPEQIANLRRLLWIAFAFNVISTFMLILLYVVLALQVFGQ